MLVEARVIKEKVAISLDLNRPDSANALNSKMIKTLRTELFKAYEDECRLVVFRGNGKHFCSGFDISRDDTSHEITERLLEIEALLQLVADAPFLTAAFVQGGAIGTGADLLAACDFRIGTPDSFFKFPGFQMSGVLIGTRRLARLVGRQNALQSVLTADRIPASQAEAMGLLSHVLETEEHDSFLESLIETAAKTKPGSIAQLKNAIDGRGGDLARIRKSIRV